ncbi:LysR family transcriptional regulator [Rhodococcus opacus]|uniref:LysR family transcriptional regulator n=1 Tax=Rhodococcus opacus TaxID=37919 RepID=A0AAX3YSZ3_RHOOP|nr:LysR family transcriptional regulator [Rhodococcus opacus]MCZ4590407.1 LysR family transcriptional regulator [Rhodococcus opacus]WLF52273.1 LysR family transcriptional regulator [Rhodococcus opacus]
MTVTHRETSVFNRHRSARQSREPLTGTLGLTDALADDLRLFAEVVRRGRLTAAANHLQINHATVSRHITPVSSKPWRTECSTAPRTAGF